MTGQARWKYVVDLVKNIKRCGEDTEDGCGCLQPKRYKKEGMASLYAEWPNTSEEGEEENIIIPLTPELVLKIFKRISDEDVTFMGFSPIWSRPDWMICQVLAVPPPAVRPSVKHDAQQRSEDDLSHILVNIIKTNKTLQEKIQNNAPESVINDWATVLQYHVASQIDNKLPGANPVAQRSGRPLKSIKDRLNGKGGRMRGNLMAKRVDFSARSVITADPNISIKELGIPMKIAKNITKPVVVNRVNKAFLTKLVQNGPDVWPGAKILEIPGVKSITLRYKDRNSIVLEDGYIVHRHMMDGDAILFNRQPTLHRMSMMCHIAKIMKIGDTFRMNVADTKPYNADFDGDEMNLHMPQDPEAESELKNLAAVPYQIISPGNNAPIIGIYQDSMLGSYRFTRENINFSHKEAMNLLMMFDRVNPAALTGGKSANGRITNFEVLSQILPPLSIKVKNKQFDGEKENVAESNNVVEIKDGHYLRGQMDKGILGSGTKGLIHRVCNSFGNMASAKFIDDLQNIVTEYMKQSSFSVGISDLITSSTTNAKIISIITDKKTDVKNLIDQVQVGVFENSSGKTNEEEFETKINNILGKAQSEAGREALKNLSKDNRFVIMFNAGSKGTEINIQQMTACLGQQNVDGKRIPYGFENRTLPHYTKYDDSPVARGFVESSYINGLSPQEVFFHAMGGRIGLIDTAVKTSTTGYIQRRLIKGMEDLMVNYDMTVRSSKGKVVQFSYGDDGIDTIKVENQEIPIVDMTVQDIYAHFNIPEDTKGKSKALSGMFVKSALTRQKKQEEEINEKCQKYTTYMIENRAKIIKNIFNFKSDKVVRLPVAFMHIIQNVMGQQNVNPNSLVDITMFEAFNLIEETYESLEQIYYARPTELFKVMYFYYLSPKDLLLNKRFNKKALDILLQTIVLDYKRSIVAPGEMVGMIAAQSIGEPTTQMSQPFCEHIRCVKINKNTKMISMVSGPIGELCDGLIEQNPEYTFNTGHVDSVETLLDALEDEYYIIGVDCQEKTHWNKISHVSRHPVNGNLMTCTTKSGRKVTTTLSHSHLIRDNQTVVPIVGADLKEGMRIPVAKHIDNTFVNDFVTIDNKPYKLDYLFGWFIGAYLAEGNVTNYGVCITNISEHFIEQTKQFAARFDKECRVYKRMGEYGPSTQTSFNSKQVAEFLLSTCGTGSFVKIIPDFAFLAPIEFKAGLIQAYMDGDGNFQSDEKHHQIRSCSRSKQLSKDIALLLNYFDIFASIKENFVRGSPIYNLSISAKYSGLYQDKIGSLVHTDKLMNLVKYCERTDVHSLSDDIDKITGLGAIIAKCGKLLELPGQSRNYGRWAKKESIGRRTLEKYIEIFETSEKVELIADEIRILKQASQSGVIWDEIVNIEIIVPEQSEYVYDFTVPANQTFMTDYGVIVHNTLNSVTYETPIIVRDREGKIKKIQIGDFIENKIKVATKTEYYKDKDTTYSEVDDYYEIPSCTEDGEMLWKRIEAVTKHPVINTDGTNVMLKITTKEQREVIVTKAKGILKLVNGKIIGITGDELRVGDYLPVSKMQIDFAETKMLDLKTILSPTEYIYSSEIEKATAVMTEYHWWSKHQGSTFTLPYKRSDSFIAKVSEKLRNGCKTKTTFAPGCVYMLQSNMNDYQIPENLPLDYNLGYLVGAYAAEGCMNRFQVSISNNVDSYFAPILEFCEKHNLTTKIYKVEDKNQKGWTSQDIRIYSTVLCRLLEHFCGKLSHNKFISNEIIFSNKECLLGFMDAYIGGDGCVNTNSKQIGHSPDISMASVSKELLMDVQQILNILGVYSKISKFKKQETNNRGSKDIKQLYNLFVRNKQSQKLASMLNIKLDYKQENLKKILAHDFKYEYCHSDTMVPNEIDGKIVMIPRDKMTNCFDTYFDKVISIEEVSNTTNYAYDLTISDTRNFNIYNGLANRDTFHFAGVASKSNVTRGVPRIEEILSLSASLKNPSLTVYLKPEDETDREKASTIQYMLEHTRLEEIVKSVEICFDPDDLNTLIDEDKNTMSQYREFETMVAECIETAVKEDETEKSKWIIRIIMDPEVMLEKNITMDDVNFTLNNVYKEEISCVYSDYNADKLVFRIRMKNIIDNAKSRSQKKAKLNPLDQSDQIYILKNFQDTLLNNIVLRGVKNIDKVILRKIKDNLVEKSGAYIKKDIWVLDTIGTNMLDVLGLDYIDPSRTYSNDIIEIFNVLGMEAARSAIYNELAEVLEFDGAYVNAHHMALLCDRMTFNFKMISIFRHGINNDDIGPIAKASFEETPEMFLKAARHAELDTMRGISANVMCGQEGLYGTASFQVVLDLNEMINLDEKYKYEYKSNEDIIEETLFAGLGEKEEMCSKRQLEIETNVGNIKMEEMGKDNSYDPFA
jgi:DNA-directed RNA polymerase beta' subunit